MELQTLIKILEESVVRNGEKPLTNKWLLNILRMAERNLSHEQEVSAEEENRWRNECTNPNQ